MEPCDNNTILPIHENSTKLPEVADIFREYFKDYEKNFNVPDSHRNVVHDIMFCRTEILGGHKKQCDSCGFEVNIYNSCGNRHCPKCQSLAKAKWLNKKKLELLPVDYFHEVFTLPHELNPLVLWNKELMFQNLFSAVSQTILTFGKDDKNGFGGQMGFTAVLHTWDQQIRSHFHLHCVIAGGALSHDENKWNQSKNDYLFPVKALSCVFRAKFVKGLREAYKNGKLKFPENLEKLHEKKEFKKFTEKLFEKEWVVYSKKPFGGPLQVLDYLGRYTHRIAISNHRILKVGDGKVTFSYRDRKDNNTLKELTISCVEFIRRFLLHILPKHFMRIRNFGFLANCHKKENLKICRELLGQPKEVPKKDEMTTQDLMLEFCGIDIKKCPKCGKGTLVTVKEILRVEIMLEDDSMACINSS